MRKKRDFDALEKRRLQGAKLLRNGMYAAQVAKELQVSRTTVSRWQKALQAGGMKGLKKAGRAGRKSFMDQKTREKIISRIKKGALQAGFATDLWTLPRIGSIIKEESGITYSETGVWKFLKTHGFSSQRPTTKAIQRNEQEIQTWKKKRWPLLKKTPKQKNKPSSL